MKNRKILKSMIVLIVAVLLCCGCSGGYTSEENPVENDSQEMVEEAPVSVQISYGSSFSNGVAWVKYIDQTGSEGIGLLNTEGIITPINEDVKPYFTADEHYDFGSDYSNGYAYRNYEDKSNPSESLNQFVVIDSSGNVVGRSPSDGNYEILTGGDGVFLVKQTVRSMTTNETRIGIIDKEGNWICEPAVQNVFSLSSTAQDNYREGDVYYLYHGEHIFSAYYDSRYDFFGSDYSCIYNADTGATAEYANTKLSIYRVPYYFSDGKAIAVSDDTVYCIDTELKTTPIIVDRPDGDVYFQDGILFTGEFSYRGNGPSPYVENGKFYRIDGSTLVDLSQYTLIINDAYDLYRYENGYASVVVYGEDKGLYLGIINIDGKFAFEPLEINSYVNKDTIGTFSCGVIATEIDKNIDGKTYSKEVLLTTTGEIVEFEVDGIEVDSLVFFDGFAWDSKGKHYIDTSGNVMNVVLNN